MPSSISNSDGYGHEARPIPTLRWGPTVITALIIMLLGVIGWEYNARFIWGYAPDAYIDNNGLWSEQRRKIKTSDQNTVALIGASRILFDYDLDTHEAMTGTRPIQLALAGTNPRPVLADLAADADFKGTLIVGITPGSFFRHGSGLSGDAPEYFTNQSPSQRLGQRISMLIEPHLAFYDQSNWPLFTLIERIDLPNREGVFSPHMSVWELAEAGRDRNTKMFWKVEDDPDYQHHAQMVWRQFMEFGDKRGPAKFDFDGYMQGVIADIESIRSRGGEVAFVRLPSSGDYRPREARLQPRNEYWDRLLRDTNSIGIHFEDHPELQGFRLPEWSHLHSDDVVPFTQALIPLLDQALKAKGHLGLINSTD